MDGAVAKRRSPWRLQDAIGLYARAAQRVRLEKYLPAHARAAVAAAVELAMKTAKGAALDWASHGTDLRLLADGVRRVLPAEASLRRQPEATTIGSTMPTRSLRSNMGRQASGQPVTPDNRPGAPGAIAAAALLQLPADGSALLISSRNTQAIKVAPRGQSSASGAAMPHGDAVEPLIPASPGSYGRAARH